MDRLKPLFHIIISLFLGYQTFQLYSFSINYQEKFPTIASVFLAILCNLVVTGTFAFVGFSFPTSKILPPSYFIIKNSKRIERIYSILGVKYFRYFLLSTFWKNKQKQKSFFNGTKYGLEQFLHSSNQAEFGHLGAFIFVELYAIIMLYKGELETFILCTFINIIFNFYPIVLQRKHRVRIQKILNNSSNGE